ncbi:hypothetical protein GCM10009737_14670 [Nocardioides lentus]|uniref:Signal transduction histidine kinase dimerisation/phosphoacceptor domain-containing protein n=1 Tax=Nocardioides lentus TaxID=338077 RepID=A0ABP5AHY5_9ACTN
MTAGPSTAGAPRLLRLFLAAEPALWWAAEAAGLAEGWQLAPLPPPGTADADPPGQRDVAVLSLDDLPAGALRQASRVAELAPARLLLLLHPDDLSDGSRFDRASQTLRLGVDDLLLRPIRPHDLRVRLALIDRRPRPLSLPAREARALLHELGNVLAAIRLTASVVGRVAGPVSDAAPGLGVPELCRRIDDEVGQAAGILTQLDGLVDVARRPELEPGAVG